MPKTTMDKDYFLLASEDYVWAARQISSMQLISITV
jgi:hypothetical protein